MTALLAPHGVVCTDATEISRQFPVRRLGGWELKPYAILHSRFREVLLLDADNVPVRNPEYLFETPEYQKTGAIFWPDFAGFDKSQKVWDLCGLARPATPEFESGQIMVDKERCWKALRLALWFNENSDFFYQHLHGDKETFHIAFHKTAKSYAFVRTPIEPLPGAMCQHDFDGARLFQHRNTDKWNLHLTNQSIPGFLYEEECRQFVRELQRLWDGRISHFPQVLTPRRSLARPLRITACMISCPARAVLREETLTNLAASDWGDAPVLVQVDREEHSCPQHRQLHTAFSALRNCLQRRADYYLFLEDDLQFNRFLRHNLLSWKPLVQGRVTLASLYNPGVSELACDPAEHCTLVSPDAVFGSQAMLISRRSLKYVLEHWDEIEGLQDIRLSRLCGRLQSPLFYHSPSLVQHVGQQSVWGGFFHQAWDYNPDWKA
jgi:hypothetical protein